MAQEKKDDGVELMLAYQAGDESAFDGLVHAYSGQVFALLTRFLGRVAWREDLVQEVFLRVIRARESYQPTARFSTWLYRIVFNLSINERERRSGRGERSLDIEERDGGAIEWEDDGAECPSDSMERDDVVHAVRSAIASLPDQQRMALILSKYEELSYSEVATVLGSTEKAIKSMVHRARENLRVALSAFLSEEFA